MGLTKGIEFYIVCPNLKLTISVMMNFLFLCLMLLLPAFAAPAAAKSVANVSDIRIGIHPDKFRLVIELDNKIAYSVFSLSRPHRIVIDLPEVNFEDDLAKLPMRGLVSALRFGLFKPGNSRIVLDLSKPALVGKSFLIPPKGADGHRLVFDLQQTDETRFLASIKPPKPRGQASAPAIEQKKKVAGEKPVVVIDPGHGGVDPGTIGVSGIYEKRITLSFSYQLKQELEKSGRYRVILTRNRDVFVKLRDRVDIARRAGGDLFLSVHADSIRDKSFHGSGVYTLSENASDKEAAALAAKENKADVIAGIDLDHHDTEVASILIDLTQRETMNYAAKLAEDLVVRLGEEGRMRRKPHRYAGFLVLKAPDIPSVLLEIGYLSNRKEEQMLRSAKKRQGIVMAVSKAVDDYFDGLAN